MKNNNNTHSKNSMGFWERNRRSDGYYLRSRARSVCISIIRGLLMFGLCFMIIEPLITRLAMGMMEEKDLYDSSIVILPRHATLENFKIVFDLTYCPESILNTMWISLVVSIFQVVSTTIVAYGFGRFEFPLKKFWFGCVIALIIIPPQTIQTSLVMSFMKFDVLGIIKLITGSTINIRSSIWPYLMMSITCMGLKNGLYIFMLRQYFRNVPESLEEAAYIDGCGSFKTFVRIMLPDALPTIASCFLFSFVWQWTDIFYTRNFLTGYRVYSKELTAIVDRMASLYSTPGQAVATVPLGRQLQLLSIGVLICSVPLIILYCFTQRTFVESLAMTGSKE